MNRGWRFCRFLQVVDVVVPPSLLVSGRRWFGSVLGHYRTQIGRKYQAALMRASGNTRPNLSELRSTQFSDTRSVPTRASTTPAVGVAAGRRQPRTRKMNIFAGTDEPQQQSGTPVAAALPHRQTHRCLSTRITAFSDGSIASVFEPTYLRGCGQGMRSGPAWPPPAPR